jgi:cholest-4-en-3-one 26-monooxygenase
MSGYYRVKKLSAHAKSGATSSNHGGSVEPDDGSCAVNQTPRLDDVELYRKGIPHAVYDGVRNDSDLYYSPGKNPFFAVLTHAEAATVLQDTANYSSALQGILIEDVSAEMRPVMRAMLPFTDPPAHTALRRSLYPPLQPNQLSGLKTQLATTCQLLVDQAVNERDIDFVHRLAAEVPLAAFGLLMGLERIQLEPLRAPSDAVIENGMNNSGDAIAALCRCLEDLVADRLREPRDDYMTRLAQVDFADQSMTRLERNGMLLQIVIGGLETTRNAMAGLLVAFSENRSEWELLRSSRDLLPNAVEESLRYVSPVNYLRRTTVKETRLGGRTLGAGSRVVVFLSAANRDPARFAQPHSLNIRRSNARQHLALGAGAHFCMGAALARMQLVAFWDAFTARVANFELLGACERAGLVQQNLIRSLPVRLHAA